MPIYVPGQMPVAPPIQRLFDLLSSCGAVALTAEQTENHLLLTARYNQDGQVRTKEVRVALPPHARDQWHGIGVSALQQLLSGGGDQPTRPSPQQPR